MKQFITKEQFYEINQAARKRWHEWVYAKEQRVKDARGMSSRPGIGQMIEFLYDHNQSTFGKVILPFIDEINKGSIQVKDPNKWCDALWEDVKEILNEK